ncbi:LacI family DNA-binding transcriptional regulator [Falsirhodobacter xinxiangensis]|uniref:LacI family DNA-binding transcriptional regulator n=1 Tax=Falsirhodobacter xinxiangensis TaxID=2530049 RepID=UPI0010AA8ED9|nr:substrate-binding domain-containing protein [Rhodobacter xinxiangensis]
MSRKFASADEVAQLAGVSRSAVSRTFTEGASVSAETRRKVMEAARALNYHVNHLARGLSQTASRPVCLIGSDLHAPFQSALLAELTAQIQTAGRATLVINTSAEAASAEAALTQALQYRASSIVVMSGSPPEALVGSCIASGQQVILINRKGTGGAASPSHVTIDYRHAMTEAAAMFARAGCGKVAVIGSTAGTPSLLARERGFVEAAQAQGMEARIVKAGPTAYATGGDAARMTLGGQGRPDGVFCVTDLIACGFMDAARRDFGLQIPRDLCVLGFDDIAEAAWGGYDLTTFRQPLPEIAARVVELISGASSERDSFLEALPVWRSSMRG